MTGRSASLQRDHRLVIVRGVVPFLGLCCRRGRRRYERGRLAGCDAYLTKPVDESLLSQTLAELEPAVFGTSLRRRPGHHRPPHS